MNRRTLFLGLVVVVVAILVLAGPSILSSMSSIRQPQAGQPGIANPASTYCVERGYRSEVRSGQGGQSGVCIFPDGGECDEWAFFRGECGAK